MLGGMALSMAGLTAGLVEFGPQWGDGAPARVTRYAEQEAPGTRALPTAAASPPAHIYSEAVRREWQEFKRRFITSDGRVVDTGNHNVSHSEGQGWGLMGAQAADDHETFERVLAWTTQVLQRRPFDSLHAWRYQPAEPNPVRDLNNATDGDLFIAAALARAAVRWKRPDYAVQASRIARDILGLVRTAGARTVLLPGAVGFDHADAFVVNPSYYGFALFPDLAALAPSPIWGELRQDGAALMLQARYGRWMLPPDWVRVDRRSGALSIAPGWPPRFSYDAIRVPLHVVWGKVPAGPVIESFCRLWQQSPGGVPPAWIDLTNGESAPYAAPPGFGAVAALATRQLNLDETRLLPSVSTASDYYGAGLILLSRIAMEEVTHSAG